MLEILGYSALLGFGAVLVFAALFALAVGFISTYTLVRMAVTRFAYPTANMRGPRQLTERETANQEPAHSPAMPEPPRQRTSP